MSKLLGISGISFLTALLGIAAAIVSFAFMLDERYGLYLLFKIRGEREPPPEIVILTVDTHRDNPLNLPEKPRMWPRSLHAGLVKNLQRQGAAMICFDLHFEEAQRDDRILAEALRNAGNVFLCEGVDRFTAETHMAIETKPPVPLLAESAAARAAVTLEKSQGGFNRYLTFITNIDANPSLPVIMFQFHAFDVLDDLIRHVEKAARLSPGTLADEQEINRENIVLAVKNLRTVFQGSPDLKERLPNELENSGISNDPGKKQKLKFLIELYGDMDNRRYLNFYGAPETISTLPYHRAVHEEMGGESGPADDFFKDKIVFVGLSESHQSDRVDNFPTVFSRPDVDLNGVEILATAFANLLEDTHIRRLQPAPHLFVILAWGILAGIVCRLVPTSMTVFALLIAGILYLAAVSHLFHAHALWVPVLVPLAVQTPFAFFVSILLSRSEIKKERRRIQNVLGYYVPRAYMKWLTENEADIRNAGKMIDGTCMFTDAKNFTPLSERLGPLELGEVMNRYYDAITGPVVENGGIVTRIIGDAMLAVWPDAGQREHACIAALDIARAVDRFNRISGNPRLPTRIGIHCGRIFFGNIGSDAHYDYTPMGNDVNTASRLESLNKYLGTWLLVSGEVLQDAGGIVSREVGEFMLVGRSKPVIVHELISKKEGAGKKREGLREVFPDALDAFKCRSWEKAAALFRECLKIEPGDGPSKFYLDLCKTYAENPPEPGWSGTVYMKSK